MKVIITGHNFSVPSKIKNYVEGRILKCVEKYFPRAIHSNVKISDDSGLIYTRITINDGTGNGVIINGNSRDHDVQRSVDCALDKIEKQLCKHKHKLKNHKLKHHLHPEGHPLYTKHFVLPHDNEEELMEYDKEQVACDDERVDNVPVVIAEENFLLSRMNVSEAIMHMDLQDVNALIFVNAATGNLNLVYYRKDGNIAWVDSKVSMINMSNKAEI